MSHELKRVQQAAQYVEESMLSHLLQYSPCDQLTVGDVKAIAVAARQIAFDEMYVKIKDQYAP